MLQCDKLLSREGSGFRVRFQYFFAVVCPHLSFTANLYEILTMDRTVQCHKVIVTKKRRVILSETPRFRVIVLSVWHWLITLKEYKQQAEVLNCTSHRKSVPALWNSQLCFEQISLTIFFFFLTKGVTKKHAEGSSVYVQITKAVVLPEPVPELGSGL